MKILFKRIVVLLLCVTLLLGDDAMQVFAGEIDAIYDKGNGETARNTEFAKAVSEKKGAEGSDGFYDFDDIDNEAKDERNDTITEPEELTEFVETELDEEYFTQDRNNILDEENILDISGTETEIQESFSIIDDDSFELANNMLSGTGTEDNPFQISNAEELAAIGTSGYYVLTEDINLADYNGGTWIPLGSSSNPFRGTFDGQNHKIYNLEKTDGKGGIWNTLSGARIKNLIIEAKPNITIVCNGLLCTTAIDTTIYQCLFDGNVYSNADSAGIVATSASGSIEECQIQGSINVKGYDGSLTHNSGGEAGGIVAQSYSSKQLLIKNCVVFADVKVDRDTSSSTKAAGICPLGHAGTWSYNYKVSPIIENCLYKGRLSARSTGYMCVDYKGGEKRCYYCNSKTVSDDANVIAKSFSDLCRSDSYNGWDFDKVWGLTSKKNAGLPVLRWAEDASYHLSDTLKLRYESFSQDSGQVIFSTHFNTSISYDRKLNIVSPNDIYFQDKSSNEIVVCDVSVSNDTDLLVETSDELLRGHKYDLIVSEGSLCDDNDIINEELNRGDYTFSVTSINFNGEGTLDDPYQIENVNQLNLIYQQPQKNYVLINDINASTVSSVNSVGEAKDGVMGAWVGYDIGGGGKKEPFSGMFDGGGYTIENINSFSGNSINGNGYDTYPALFSSTNGATIKNLNITLSDQFKTHYSKWGGSAVSALHWPCVAGIVAKGTGSIVGCSVRGDINTIDCTDYSGLIAGNFDGVIERCTISGSISNSGSTSSQIGGMVGHLGKNGVVRDCYSFTDVNGSSSNLGGLVGKNDGRISTSYSIGKVGNSHGLVGKNTGNIENSYYNADLAGTTDSQVGIPLSNVDMLEKGSYVGFDFENVWKYDLGRYPYIDSIDNLKYYGANGKLLHITDTDEYYQKYGISYLDLFTKCPTYLEKGLFPNIEGRLVQAAIDAENEISFSNEWWASYFASLGKGTRVLVNHIGGAVGLTDTEYEKYQYELAYELLREYSSIADYNSIAKEAFNSRYFELFGVALEGLDNEFTSNNADEMAKIINSINPQISISDAKDLVNTAYFENINKQYGKFVKSTSTVADVASVVGGLLILYEIDLDLLENLIEIQKVAGNTELLYALKKIQDERTSNPIKYISNNYLRDEVFDILTDKLSLDSYLNLFDKGTVMWAQLASAGMKIVYECNEPSVDDIVNVAVLHTYWQGCENACQYYISEFIRGNASIENIVRYEMAYDFKLTCLKLWLQKAKRCTSDEMIRNRLEWYKDIGKDGSFSYDSYIDGCMKAVSDDIKSGKLTITNDGTVKKLSDGTLIDDSYDSTENIEKRINEIFEYYTPNVNQSWNETWRGQTGELGFARMVFSNLYECELPSFVSTEHNYELVNNGNILFVDQLSGMDVIPEKIAAIFEKSKVGDLVQGYGDINGFSTSIVTNVASEGIVLYEYNSIQNEINNCFYTWEQLSNRYSSPQNDNGLTIYRSITYSTVGDDVLSFSLSLDEQFKIEEGVLEQYLGEDAIIIIPEGVVKIADSCFKNNKYIQKVSFPNSLKTIGDYAFYGCNALSGEIVLPNNIESIGKYAFWGCKIGGNLIIPASMENINEYAFGGCTGEFEELIIEGNMTINKFEALPNMLNFHTIVNKSSKELILPSDSTYYWYNSNDVERKQIDSIANGIAKRTSLVTTVFFDANGGSLDEVSRVVRPGSFIGKLPIPQSKNAIFDGWYTQRNGGTKITSELRVAASDYVTLYAHWNNDNEEILPKDYEEYIEKGCPSDFWVANINQEGYQYTGAPIKPSFRVYYGKIHLIENEDYSISYKNNINIGTATVTVKGKGNYTKAFIFPFSIISRTIGEGSEFAEGFVCSISDKQYTGKALLSKPTIKYGNRTLKENKDYTLTFSGQSLIEGNPVNVGEVIIEVIGKGNYTGRAKTFYRIYDKGMDFSKVIIDKIADKVYTGQPITLTEEELKVFIDVQKNSKLKLYNDKTGLGDYSVEYQNNTDAGRATIIVKGCCDYEGYGNCKKVSFKIVPKPIENVSVMVRGNVGKNGTCEYTGSSITPEVYIKDLDRGVLIDSSNYTLKYSNNTNVADSSAKKAPTATIKGKGNYTGTVNVPFNITPLELSDSELDIVIPDIKDNGKTIAASNIKPVVKYANPVIGKTVTLKSGTDYTVDFTRDTGSIVQTAKIVLKGNYKNDGDISEEFKIYAAQTVLNATDFTVSVDDTELVYTGGKLTPNVTVKEATASEEILKAGKDYTVSYSNNVNGADKNAPGANVKKLPTVKITGKGLYKGTLTQTFSIQPMTLSESDFDVVIGDVLCNPKKEQTPTVTVTNKATKKALKSADYTIAVDGSTKTVSEAIDITISGKGNYDGPINKTFRVYGTDIGKMVFDKIENQAYKGSAIRPAGDAVKVYADKKKTAKLTEGTDYVLEYGENVKAGSGSVMVKGIGNYGGSKTVKFTIVPKWLQWLLL